MIDLQQMTTLQIGARRHCLSYLDETIHGKINEVAPLGKAEELDRNEDHGGGPSLVQP